MNDKLKKRVGEVDKNSLSAIDWLNERIKEKKR